MENLTLPNIDARRNAAESLFGSIDWTDSDRGLLRCPGADLHTHRTGKRDCEIHLDGAPTLYCFHTSCAGALEEANRRLRSAIGKAEAGEQLQPYRPSPADIERQRQKARAEALKNRAARSLAAILAGNGVNEADFRDSSPHPLEGDPADDWRLLLSMFAPDDVVWIGHVYDSGKPEHARNFRPVSEWLKESKAPGNFTCPSTFKNNSVTRSNDNAIARRFLVVESDKLKREETLAVVQWLRSFLTLRAVVCTGGKSLHGWFDFPAGAILEELRIILPELRCDPALFKVSQPCRLPGAWRADKGKIQSLIWFGGAR